MESWTIRITANLKDLKRLTDHLFDDEAYAYRIVEKD